MTSLIEDGATVLFQGDSITDSDRNRYDGNHLGSGYALMAAGWFSALYPEKSVNFLNRGISGDRAVDLPIQTAGHRHFERADGGSRATLFRPNVTRPHPVCIQSTFDPQA